MYKGAGGREEGEGREELVGRERGKEGYIEERVDGVGRGGWVGGGGGRGGGG